MGCPHIQQTARALRSRSHAIFRVYGQRDARPTLVVLLFCVCCIADPAPAAHCPALVYIRLVLSPVLLAGPVLPRGVLVGAVSPHGAMVFRVLSACTEKGTVPVRVQCPERST